MVVLVGLALAVPVGGIGPAAAAPAPEDLPANTVALVSHAPVSLGTVTQVELHHALVQAAAADGRRSLPKPGKRRSELRRVALDDLLESIWVQGQARAMGIAVSPRQVSRELGRIKRESFKNAAEYRRYLRRAHFTRRDVNERVELQLLAELIEERVTAGRGAEAFGEFVDAYLKRWRARTVCAPAYAIDRCSNGPLPTP